MPVQAATRANKKQLTYSPPPAGRPTCRLSFFPADRESVLRFALSELDISYRRHFFPNVDSAYAAPAFCDSLSSAIAIARSPSAYAVVPALITRIIALIWSFVIATGTDGFAAS